jgi:hypothetical protein
VPATEVPFFWCDGFLWTFQILLTGALDELGEGHVVFPYLSARSENTVGRTQSVDFAGLTISFAP